MPLNPGYRPTGPAKLPSNPIGVCPGGRFGLSKKILLEASRREAARQAQVCATWGPPKAAVHILVMWAAKLCTRGAPYKKEISGLTILASIDRSKSEFRLYLLVKRSSQL